MRIDEKSVVPLGWVITGMGAGIGATIAGVFWVSTVNFRLERIEEKLGIPQYHSELSIVKPAFAGKRIIYDNL
jgi:hypothetical protein